MYTRTWLSCPQMFIRAAAALRRLHKKQTWCCHCDRKGRSMHASQHAACNGALRGCQLLSKAQICMQRRWSMWRFNFHANVQSLQIYFARSAAGMCTHACRGVRILAELMPRSSASTAPCRVGDAPGQAACLKASRSPLQYHMGVIGFRASRHPEYDGAQRRHMWCRSRIPPHALQFHAL